MRRYWEERSRLNAAYYVDTSLDFDHPDMEQFFATGRRIVAEALDDAPVSPEGRDLAVEIGCGLGRVCLALADRFDRVVGIDVAEGMVSRATQLIQNPKVEILVGDGQTLQPLQTGAADLVLSFTVFQHITRLAVIRSYLQETARVLKPGGVAVIQWNSSSGTWAWVARRTARDLLQRTRIAGDRHQRDAAEFLGSSVPAAKMAAMADDAGLTVVGTRGTGSLFSWMWAQRR
jgi:SAM-dependent methyltransferase